MMLLSSLFKTIMLPPMIFISVALLALIFYKKYFPVLAASIIIFTILSFQFVENKIALSWESFPPLTSDRIQQFKPQAIVVLGGGIHKDDFEYKTPIALKVGTLLRVRYAAKLAKEIGLPVLTSGGHTLNESLPSEAELMAAVMADEFGMPVKWQESQSINTLQNAKLSYEILQKQGINRIILITQAYHMPRAEKQFRKAGFQVLPAPTAFMSHAPRQSDWSDWIPSVKALESCYLISYEVLGMLWYALHD